MFAKFKVVQGLGQKMRPMTPRKMPRSWMIIHGPLRFAALLERSFQLNLDDVHCLASPHVLARINRARGEGPKPPKVAQIALVTPYFWDPGRAQSLELSSRPGHLNSGDSSVFPDPT